MAFLDEVIDKAQKAGKFVCDKAIDAKDYVSLEYKLSVTRNKTDELYKELGKLVFANNNTDNDTEGEINQLIAKIQQLIIEQNELCAQISKFKNICPSCGNANPNSADFFNNCGGSLK